jgi:S-adenosylmethionine synthetase
MGRKPKKLKKSFISSSGEIKEIEVELFTWEKLDYVDIIKKKLK